MGDASDYCELERFMNCQEGKQHLESFTAMLNGHRINDVSFSNETSVIAMTLHLDDGETFVVYPPSLDVGALRQQFEEILDREYYLEFPERKPTV